MALKRHNLFAIVILCSLVYANSRSVSISQTGDVRIELTDDKWLCDKIECPKDAERCYVSKKNDEKDPSILVRTNICYSKDNVSLNESITTSKVDPNEKITVEINSHRSGSISTVNSSNGSYSNNYNGNFNFNGDSDFDADKFNADLNKDLEELNTNIENQVANINKEVNDNLEKLSYNLAHMFD